MSQYDVYLNTGKNRKIIPYVLDVQSDLISSGLSTKVVVPLYMAKLIKRAALKIHVPVEVRSTRLLALFNEISSVDSEVLTSPIVNLSSLYDVQFKDALDVMFFNLP